MNQTERRVWLLDYLLHEEPGYRLQKIPPGEQEQRQLLRALMNVRPPRPISEEFLRVQDAYLSVRRHERGVTEGDALPAAPAHAKISLWQGDITTLACGAIVNACNAQMLGCFQPLHGCIDNFIHTYAGVQLRLKMYEIMQKQGHDEPVGQAKITSGYNLPAEHILHTVGPVIAGHVTRRDEEALRSCYRACLELAEENHVPSVAFCCISTGVFRFPKRHAAQIAVQTVLDFLDRQDVVQKVIFNVFQDTDLQIYEELLS